MFVLTRQTSFNKTGHILKVSQDDHLDPEPVGIVDAELHKDVNTNIKINNALRFYNAMNSPSKVSRKNNIKTASLKKPKPCYNVHIFYYPWYGNPKFDKDYIHWNHQYIPHWSPEIAKIYPRGAHKPPDDIASNFYPKLGPYSSNSSKVIRNHMQQLSFAGVGVIAVSYYPPGLADDNGDDWKSIYPKLLKAADIYKIKVTFHIEPYNGRSEVTVQNDIENIIDTYSKYPAFYKLSYKNKLLPLVYIYDSYHTKASHWSKLLKPGEDSIRGTEYDCFVIGLVVEETHLADMVVSGFDGFYTYFASTGFTYGSSREHWGVLSNFAVKNNLLYIPSIGPGYVDTRVRPWNGGNTRKRLNGKYYKESWKKALSFYPEIISVTSFNEWHEGTQIEKAIPKVMENYKYLDYLPKNPDYYLVLTKKFVQSFVKQKNKMDQLKS